MACDFYTLDIEGTIKHSFRCKQPDPTPMYTNWPRQWVLLSLRYKSDASKYNAIVTTSLVMKLIRFEDMKYLKG